MKNKTTHVTNKLLECKLNLIIWLTVVSAAVVVTSRLDFKVPLMCP